MKRSRFAKNNLVRRIIEVKRADKRRMEEMTMEFGVKESFKTNLVRSSLIWSGDV